MLFIFGFSGCFSSEKTNDEIDNIEEKEYIFLSDGTKVYGDFDKVEVVNYTAFTDREIDYWEYETITDGLVYSEEAARYRLNVTIKNIANELLDRIYVYVYFYDNQGNHLYSDENGCKDLHINDTCVVELDWNNHFSSSNFEHLDYIEFEVQVYQI